MTSPDFSSVQCVCVRARAHLSFLWSRKKALRDGFKGSELIYFSKSSLAPEMLINCTIAAQLSQSVTAELHNSKQKRMWKKRVTGGRRCEQKLGRFWRKQDWKRGEGWCDEKKKQSTEALSTRALLLWSRPPLPSYSGTVHSSFLHLFSACT